MYLKAGKLTIQNNGCLSLSFFMNISSYAAIFLAIAFYRPATALDRSSSNAGSSTIRRTRGPYLALKVFPCVLPISSPSSFCSSMFFRPYNAAVSWNWNTTRPFLDTIEALLESDLSWWLLATCWVELRLWGIKMAPLSVLWEGVFAWTLSEWLVVDSILRWSLSKMWFWGTAFEVIGGSTDVCSRSNCILSGAGVPPVRVEFRSPWRCCVIPKCLT